MKWVKITPDTIPDAEVLAISMVHGPSYKEYLVGRICKKADSKTGYACESDNEILYDVTHWITTPAPPQDN
jgi:hypothetical protein